MTSQNIYVVTQINKYYKNFIKVFSLSLLYYRIILLRVSLGENKKI